MVSSKNKHESHLIRKKFRKCEPYKCCYVCDKNYTKLSKGYCTAATKYRQREQKLYAIMEINDIMREQRL
jgi:hypothetical protein